MPHDFAFGIIPIRKTESGGLEVLLLAKLREDGTAWWGFPKGHAEAGEDAKATALREFAEETGLTLTRLFDEKTFSESYVTEKDGVKMQKLVTYFVGIAGDGPVRIDRTEIHDFRWAPTDLVPEILSRDNTKTMFCEAISAIETLMDLRISSSPSSPANLR